MEYYDVLFARALSGGSGGGGSSDFTYETLSVTNNASEAVTIYGSCYGNFYDTDTTASVIIIGPNDTVTLNVILYKGSAWLEYMGMVSVEATGEVIAEDGEITMTGSGAIIFDNDGK